MPDLRSNHTSDSKGVHFSRRRKPTNDQTPKKDVNKNHMPDLGTNTSDSNGVHFSRRRKPTNDQTSTKDVNKNHMTLPDLHCPQRLESGNIILTGRRNKFVLLRKDLKLPSEKTPKTSKISLPPIESSEELRRNSSLTASRRSIFPQRGPTHSSTCWSSLRDRRTLSTVELALKDEHKRFKGLNPSTLQTVSFKQHLDRFRQTVDRLVKVYGNTIELMTQSFIEKIVVYVSTLTKYRQDTVDETIFAAVLGNRMNMRACPEQYWDLYNVLLNGEKAKNPLVTETLNIEAFSNFICILITENQTEKANIVYNMFDPVGQGFFTEYDLNVFIEPLVKASIILKKKDEEDMSELLDIERLKLPVHELTEAAMRTIDKENGTKIYRQDFISAVIKDSSLLDAFGLVLPTGNDMRDFVEMLDAHEEKNIHCIFRNERKTLLRNTLDNNESFIQSFYPVTLQFC